MSDILRRALAWLLRRMVAEIQSRWNRVLPIGEVLSDRWERARLLGAGPRTSVYDSAVVLGRPKIGADCWIGPNAVLDGSGGLALGDWVSVAAGVQIYSHSTRARMLAASNDVPIDTAPTTIGSRVVIGPGAVIQAGVTVGDGATIGALSFVREDVPPGQTWAGVPARRIFP